MSFKIPKRNLASRIKKDKVVTDYEPEEIAYLAKPLGKAAYEFTEGGEEDALGEEEDSSEYEYYYSDDEAEHSSDYEYYYSDDEKDNIPPEPMPKIETGNSKNSPKAAGKTKKHWSDRIVCDVCGVTYTRSAVSGHKGTKKHQIYANTNKKLLKLMQE